jgi:hemin uptake protein HemP
MDSCAKLETKKDNTPHPLPEDRRVDSQTLLGKKVV